MNHLRKISTLLLALALVFSLAISVSADNTASHTITITNTQSGHIYEAYQVFKGNISAGKLVDIEWGSGVNATDLLLALKADTIIGSKFTDATTAADVAVIISQDSFTAADVDAFAQIVGANLSTTVAGTSTEAESGYTISVTGDGYYIVKDKDNSLTGESTAYTKYILKVVEDVTVAAKQDVPTLEKKIVEGQQTVDANGKSIGDKVDYQLTAKVPGMDGYNKYFFIIHDDLSDGLTFIPTSVKVTLDGTELTSGTDYDVVITGLSDDCDFEIVFKDFIKKKSYAGKNIVVTYSALINEKASVGTTGNTNTANLEYSNNPNVDYKGDEENPNRPGPNEPTGETPKDTVITYTTEIKLTKVDADTQKNLTGAKFSISGISNKVRIINQEMYVEDVSGTYYRLKDGTYTTTAPVAEDNPDTPDTDEKTIDSYDEPSKKYKKVTEVTTTTVEEEFVTEGWVKSDGTLTFTGLGEGTYTIKEIVAPAGYNLLKEDITVVITSNAGSITDPNASTTVTWTAKDGNGETAKNYTVADGKISLTVENKAGSTLPSTGGIGTTMFYVIGGILVLAAVVLLVTKKRMGNVE